ncbi:MAG: hypothetical protein ACOH1P_11205 [Lysobacter sp.]
MPKQVKPETAMTRVLKGLRSTRDLRAEVLDLAVLALVNPGPAQLNVKAPAISPETVRAEWERVLPALAPAVRGRLQLVIEAVRQRGEGLLVPLGRPNYRHEVLRLLIGASVGGDALPKAAGKIESISGTQPGLIEAIGASQTPIRKALAALRDAGIIESLRRLGLSPEELSLETLGRVGALPKTLRFRFERGAQIKPPPALLARAQKLLRTGGPTSWAVLSLSGTPVAQRDVPELDLIGTPRLDLVAQLGRQCTTFDADLLRLLDDGLELEPNVLASAPVVVTIVRADASFTRQAAGVRCAYPMDVLLALLDLGLREQAIHYARTMRQ